jgi:hypothetical protein
MVMGILSILATLGMGLTDLNGFALVSVQEELRGAVHQAFILARAQGRDVVVSLGNPQQSGVIPVKLPAQVKWGKPVGIPVPKGMAEPKVAGTTGQAHSRITVTPHHTATASAWFLNDGRNVLCMRLSGHGHLQMMRWSHLRSCWVLV